MRSHALLSGGAGAAGVVCSLEVDQPHVPEGLRHHRCQGGRSVRFGNDVGVAQPDLGGRSPRRTSRTRRRPGPPCPAPCWRSSRRDRPCLPLRAERRSFPAAPRTRRRCRQSRRARSPNPRVPGDTRPARRPRPRPFVRCARRDDLQPGLPARIGDDALERRGERVHERVVRGDATREVRRELHRTARLGHVEDAAAGRAQRGCGGRQHGGRFCRGSRCRARHQRQTE